MSPEDEEILQKLEQATEEMSQAEDEIKADSKEIKELRNNDYQPVNGPGFFKVLGIAVKGLFTI